MWSKNTSASEPMMSQPPTPIPVRRAWIPTTSSAPGDPVPSMFFFRDQDGNKFVIAEESD
jgi:hypothetical protein